jgi:3-oxoacyl-[acyl-carrier-protein] synthase II
VSTRARVAVTGLGVVSPVGCDVASAWRNTVEGRSGITPIRHFDASAYPTRIAGTVQGFDPGEHLPERECRRMDPFIQYGIVAGMQAYRDAGLEGSTLGERGGVIVGSGIGGIGTIEKNRDLLVAHHGPRKISPFFIPGSIINMIAGHLSIMLGLQGLNLGVVTACTTGAHAIGLGYWAVQRGEADVVLAGGAEMGATELGLAGFCAARALSTRNDEPTRASRPWDRDRDGFVLSDGAAILVLEDMDHARRRGARIYAELIGFGMSADAHHITAPPEDGDGARRCMLRALADAHVAPEEVDYINAHGTSTPLGDRAETVAIKRAFGDHARRLAVSSTKSVTGHMLGAAGSIEAVFSVLALRDQVIPPTVNLDEPDEGCDLDYVPHTARAQKLEVVLSNSFGFGGTNGSLVFRRYR